MVVVVSFECVSFVAGAAAECRRGPDSHPTAAQDLRTLEDGKFRGGQSAKTEQPCVKPTATRQATEAGIVLETYTPLTTIPKPRRIAPTIVSGHHADSVATWTTRTQARPSSRACNKLIRPQTPQAGRRYHRPIASPRPRQSLTARFGVHCDNLRLAIHRKHHLRKVSLEKHQPVRAGAARQSLWA